MKTLDLASYNLLPNGIIVFQDEKIIFINEHLLEVLNLSFLPLEEAIKHLLNILNFKTQALLFNFFNHQEFFTLNAKRIIIAKNAYDDLLIFSFIKVPKSLCETTATQEHQEKINIDKNVAKFLQLHKVSQLKVLTFYKGLPLKNIGKVIRISEDVIEVLVDHKHQISLLKRDDILLISNTKKGRLVLHGHVIESQKNLFKINNFSLSSEDMHQREGIRIKPQENSICTIEDVTFKIYDISLKGISIFIHSKEEENLIKTQKSITILLNNEEIKLSIKYLKSIYLKDGDVLKAIFTISSNNENRDKIQSYLNKAQQEIIREIHHFSLEQKYL